MLELQNVSFGAGNKEILRDINLVLEDSQFYVITGPNGGGKSTLAKLIMGIETPDRGRIFFDGADITHMSVTDRANRGISFAFQQPVRFKGVTVFDLLKLAAGKKTLSKDEACEYLSQVGLCALDYIDRSVDASLSGGELKRIEIATVIARGRKLSIFDEPEAGIDLWSFNHLIQVFEAMYERNGDSSILIISHQERILSIADKIIVVAGGRIAEMGEKDEILPSLLKNTNRDACAFKRKVVP